MATEAMIDHSRALLQGKMDEAKKCVERLAAVDEQEAEYRLIVTSKQWLYSYFGCLPFTWTNRSGHSLNKW